MKRLVFGKKEMDFENPDKNFSIIATKATEVCPGAEVKRVGNVKVIVRRADTVARKRLIDEIHGEYKNAKVEEKGDRVVIDIGLPLAEKIEKEKKKRQPLLQQIKKARRSQSSVESAWIDEFGGVSPRTPSPRLKLRHVSPRVASNVGLRQLRAKAEKKRRPSQGDILLGVRHILERAQDAYVQQEDTRALDTVHKMFDKYQKLADRIQQNARVQGVARLLQQAEAEVAALEWEKELEEKEKARRAVHALKHVVDQIKKGEIRLKAVDRGADEWAAQLAQEGRVVGIRQKMSAPLAQIRKGKKNLRKVGIDAVQRRLQKAVEAVVEDEKKRIRAEEAAMEWGRELDAERELAQSRSKCKEWVKSGRTKNPFNTSGRGRKLHTDGPTADDIDLFCKDPLWFCENKKKARLALKAC